LVLIYDKNRTEIVMKKAELQRNDKLFLRSLGLSIDEIELYELLLGSKKAMTAQQTSGYFIRFPSAMYRLFYGLEELGLIVQTNIRPKSYKAIEPSQAFQRALEQKRQMLEKQLSSLSFEQDALTPLPAEIIIGREALYKRYELEVSKACISVNAHSIGIAFSDNMYAVTRLAIKRGVKFKYAFQQFKPENFIILTKWKEVGVDLRHYKTERGLHMMIFDDSKIIISFSNPINTDDRISIVTSNKAMCSLFVNYFNSIWINAKQINL
jgi:sugar-specific transcriptional regulator TrmB